MSTQLKPPIRIFRHTPDFSWGSDAHREIRRGGGSRVGWIAAALIAVAAFFGSVCVARAADKIVVAGTADSDFGVVRYNSDGSLSIIEGDEP